MDAFEKFSSELLATRKQDRWKAYEAEKASCICPKCPSYNHCATRQRELLFCLLGMSFYCIRDDRGCTCPQCSLYKKYALTGKDFCMKGSEKAMRYEKGLG